MPRASVRALPCAVESKRLRDKKAQLVVRAPTGLIDLSQGISVPLMYLSLYNICLQERGSQKNKQKKCRSHDGMPPNGTNPKIFPGSRTILQQRS